MNQPIFLQDRTFFQRILRKASKILHKNPSLEQKEILPIRVGIIGSGNVVRWKYAPYLKTSPLYKVEAIYDLSIDSAKHLSSIVGGTVCENPDQIFHNQDIDAVFICTPTKTHAELILKALSANKHILCEKPMSTTLTEAKAIWKAAKDNQKIHMVNFIFRFEPEWMFLYQIIKSGLIGDVYTAWGTLAQGGWLNASDRNDIAPWRLKSGGGVLHELGSHLIHTCRWLFGEVEEVQGWIKTLDKTSPESFEDMCGMSLHFSSGCSAVLEISRLATGYRNRNFLEIYGSKGTVKMDQGNISLWTEEDPRWRNLLIPIYSNSDFLDCFYKAVREGKESVSLLPTFYDGLKNAEVIDAIFRNTETTHVF